MRSRASTQVVRSGIACLVALLLVGCASSSAPGGVVAPTPADALPASALPELESRTRALALSDVASDGGGGALADLLAGAGFVSGSEREFFGRGSDFSRVLARALLFQEPRGASEYLAWINSHGVAGLGPSTIADPPSLGDSSVLLAFQPKCGCKSDVPAFLLAWGRGRTVLWLYAAGTGASRHSVLALAHVADSGLGEQSSASATGV